MKTTFGKFAEWLHSEIPIYVDKKVELATRGLKDGADGADGTSVVDAEVAMDGHLVLKLSTGKIIDAGEIVTEIAKNTHVLARSLQNQQITVSLTAPSNPQVNDLWYDLN